MKNYFFFVLFSSKIIFATTNSSVNKEQAKEWMAAQPVLFLENKGQMADTKGNSIPFVFFKAQAPGIDMYITEKGLTYIFLKSEEGKEKKERSLNTGSAVVGVAADENTKTEWERIDMTLGGACIKKENIFKEGKSENFFQYFLANCSKGISEVYSYKKITIKEIYPGIDWVLYNSDNKGFKYDFLVHPGADHKQIELIYSSLNKLQIGNNGEIKIETGLGTLTENTPISYQANKEIPSHFTAIFNNKNIGYETHIKFAIESYNPNELLVIDPKLVWATIFAGYDLTGPRSIVSDQTGNIFITGYNDWTNFPVCDPGGGAYFRGLILVSRMPSLLNSVTPVNYYGLLIMEVAYMMQLLLFVQTEQEIFSLQVPHNLLISQ